MVDLGGAKVLVVEDEYLIAADLARALCAAGGQPIGPAASLEQARELMRQQPIGAAILDLNLRGEMAFPLVTELSDRGLPFVIMSGYSPESLPDFVCRAPGIEKPVDYHRVIELLSKQLVSKAV